MWKALEINICSYIYSLITLSLYFSPLVMDELSKLVVNEISGYKLADDIILVYETREVISSKIMLRKAL